MLSKNLMNIYDYLITKDGIPKSKIIEFLNYFDTYDINELIHLQGCTLNTSLTEEEAYITFSYLVEKSVLKVVYKVICPKCEHRHIKVFKSFREIDEYKYCNKCGNKIIDENNLYKYLEVLYKVVSKNV